MEYNNNYYGQQPAMGMGATPYMAQPYTQNNGPTPTYVSSLNEDEFKLIQNKPTSKFDITISQEDNIIAMCNHKDLRTGQDVVRKVNDGTDDVYCPICGQRWSQQKVSKEELVEIIARLNDAMQQCKWVGDLNIQLIRDYFPISPLLQKFPELYEQSMAQFSRYLNQNAYADANDANVYYQYNALMGRAPMTQGYGMAAPYGQPAMNQPTYPYGQQPPVQQGGYNPNPAMGGQNPMYNPMQARPMNTQFTDQNQMMMQGQYYQQPPVQQNYAPNPNAAYQPNMQAQAQPYPYGQQPQPTVNMGQPPVQQNYAPNYAPAQQPAGNVEAKADAGVNNDTVTKDTSIKIN